MKNTWYRIIFILVLLVSSASSAQELSFRPMLRLATEMHYAKIKSISADAAGRYLLTCSYDKTARLWDINDGTLLKILRVPADEENEGKLYACALSADGKTAALGGWTGSVSQRTSNIYLFNVATGKIIQRLSGMNNVVDDLEFYSDTILAAALHGGQGIRIFERSGDKYTLRMKDTAYGDTCYSLSFDRSGRLATACYDGYVRLYDNQFNLVKKKNTAGGRLCRYVSFSPDGSKLAVGYNDSATVEVLSGNSLDLLYRPKNKRAKSTDMRLNKLAFGPGGHLFGGGRYRKVIDGTVWFLIRRWDRDGAGRFKDFKAADNIIIDIKALADGSVLVGGGQPDFGRYTSKGKNIFYKRAETLDYKNRDLLDHFTVNRDGSAISFNAMGINPFTFNIQNRELKQAATRYEKYRDTHRGITLKNWRNSYSPMLNNRNMNFLAKHELCRSVDIGDDGTILVGADWFLYALDRSGRIKWKTAVPETAWSVNIAGNGQVAVVAHGNGEIRWCRMADGAALLSLFVLTDGRRWILTTPDGYYDTAPGSDTFLGWHINNGRDQVPDFFPVGKFAAKYYRPEIVAQVLQNIDVGKPTMAADWAPNRHTNIPDLKQMLPPVVTVLYPTDSTGVTDSPVTVGYQVRSPSGEKVTGVKAFVDGRPLGKLDIDALEAGGVSEATEET